MRVGSAAATMCVGFILLAGGAAAGETNVLVLGEGTLPVVEPPSYGGWGPVNILDDAPGSAWASTEKNVANNVFVFEMAAAGTIDAFEFDCTGLDGKGRGAKDVRVEVSDDSRETGFERVLAASLVEGKANQRFPAGKQVEGRWVRLTIVGNHGDSEYVELGGIRGFGRRSTAATATMPAIAAIRRNTGLA